MAELSCISRLYCLTRNFAHLIKAKSSLKVSVRTFLIRISPPSALPPLLSRTVSCQSGWPRGLGALNSSPHSSLLNISTSVSVVSRLRTYLWSTSATVRIPVHTTICDASLLRSAWCSFDQLQSESRRNQRCYVWNREKRENERSHSLLVWTEALSGIVFEPSQELSGRVFNSPIDDVPSKTESGRPIVICK